MRQGELSFRAPERESFAPGAWLLRGFALADEAALLVALAEVVAAAPFRHMSTPGGRRMAAAMTNCGALGWVGDRRGYRYEACDPDTGRPWPAMPAVFAALAARAAHAGGYDGFRPDACLVNRYAPGAGMGQHADADERDFSQPIVSVSLGLPATFRFGGPVRGGRTAAIALQHGDVVVFGGPSRRSYHGVAPPRPGVHPAVGPWRVNLTLRVAG